MKTTISLYIYKYIKKTAILDIYLTSKCINVYSNAIFASHVRYLPSPPIKQLLLSKLKIYIVFVCADICIKLSRVFFKISLVVIRTFILTLIICLFFWIFSLFFPTKFIVMKKKWKKKYIGDIYYFVAYYSFALSYVEFTNRPKSDQNTDYK